MIKILGFRAYNVAMRHFETSSRGPVDLYSTCSFAYGWQRQISTIFIPISAIGLPDDGIYGVYWYTRNTRYNTGDSCE
jgi:hypothetical protein